MNLSNILLFLFGALLLITSYQIFEKENQINYLNNELTESKNKLRYIEAQRDQALAQLSINNQEIEKLQLRIIELNTSLNNLNRYILELNNTIKNKSDEYDLLLAEYIKLNQTFGDIERMNKLIEEINYRLSWVKLNYETESEIYLEVKNKVREYCLNNSVMDIACSYILLEKYMNYVDTNDRDIHSALKAGEGDCLAFSILLDRLIKDLKPLRLSYLTKSIGGSHSFFINNTRIVIRDVVSIQKEFNNTEVVCYGIKNEGHCSVRVDDIVLDRYLYIGEIGKNIDICYNKNCEWLNGWITMRINSNDIVYLNESLKKYKR